MKTGRALLITVLALFGSAFALAPTDVLANMDCPDFTSQGEAQAYFGSRGGSSSNNVDRLDADHDGIACESLPYSSMPNTLPTTTSIKPSTRTPSASTASDDAGFPWALTGAGVVVAGGAYAFVQSRKKGQPAPVATSRPSKPLPMSQRTTIPDLSMKQSALPTVTAPSYPSGWPFVTPARAKELATMPYPAYLQTIEWKKRAGLTKTAAGNRCQLCNRSATLQAHHRTYDRRGNELPGDLIALCDTCHAKFHDKPVA